MNESLQPFEVQREALTERLKLKEQWESQIKILNEVGILEILPESQELGIIGIDQKEYPIPNYEDILNKITQEQADLVTQKTEQGFNKLILVPFAKSLQETIELYARLLVQKKHEKTLVGAENEEFDLDINNPIVDMTKNDSLFYIPSNGKRFTKSEFLVSEMRYPGWQVALIEDSPVPFEKDSDKKEYGYKQPNGDLVRDWSHQLKLMKENESYIGEEEISPEAWLAYAITNLKEKNQQIDFQNESIDRCWLGAFSKKGETVYSLFKNNQINFHIYSPFEREKSKAIFRSVVQI